MKHVVRRAAVAAAIAAGTLAALPASPASAETNEFCLTLHEIAYDSIRGFSEFSGHTAWERLRYVGGYLSTVQDLNANGCW